MEKNIFAYLGMVCVVSYCGCGKSEYESKVREKLDRLAFSSKFLENLQSTPIPVIDGAAVMRMPKDFDEDSETMHIGKRNRRQEPIDPRRIQPPGMQIPGFRFSYEKFLPLEGRNNTQPIYCYVASVPAKQKLNAVLSPILAGARRISRTAAWTDVQLDTPGGQKRPFKKLSVQGAQDFEMDPGGGDIQKKSGRLDMYVFSSPDHHVVIGFRGTDEALAESDVVQKGEFAVGTLEILAPADGEDAES